MLEPRDKVWHLSHGSLCSALLFELYDSLDVCNDGLVCTVSPLLGFRLGRRSFADFIMVVLSPDFWRLSSLPALLSSLLFSLPYLAHLSFCVHLTWFLVLLFDDSEKQWFSLHNKSPWDSEQAKWGEFSVLQELGISLDKRQKCTGCQFLTKQWFLCFWSHPLNPFVSHCLCEKLRCLVLSPLKILHLVDWEEYILGLEILPFFDIWVQSHSRLPLTFNTRIHWELLSKEVPSGSYRSSVTPPLWCALKTAHTKLECNYFFLMMVMRYLADYVEEAIDSSSYLVLQTVKCYLNLSLCLVLKLDLHLYVDMSMPLVEAINHFA